MNTKIISEYEPNREFGIETSCDLYIDNLPKGRYTKSGIRFKDERQ